MLALSLLMLGAPLAGASEDSPNLILIVTDDQGYGDFSFAEHGALETPHLDALRLECPQVDRFYVSPVCSPTRASLMTGRWNYRTGVTDTWIGRSMMSPEEVTVAEALQGAGYDTGIFGKWHLGDCYPMRPMDQGFGTSLVHRGGGLAQPSEPPANKRRYTDPVLFRNGEAVETKGYCTDVYFDAALDFIDRSVEDESPFFCYVATNAPHDPFHDVPEELYAKYRAKDMAPTLRGRSDKVDREARICAMIENVDRNVGRLLARLDEKEIANETVVVFLCDNGPLWGRTTGGLRGYKTQPYEGGIRSPLLVRWPGELSHRARVEEIAAHVDVMPTLLELAGVKSPSGVRFDGRSLVPLLMGKKVEWQERYLFLQSHRGNRPLPGRHFAVVGQRWKLVRASGFDGKLEGQQGTPFELFDLGEDPAEAVDVAEENPEVVDELKGRYRDWYEDVVSGAVGWEPQRIVLDANAEPVTALTRQDLRFETGEGWAAEGEPGSWYLRAPEKQVRKAALLFTEPTKVDSAHIEVRPSESEVITYGLSPRSTGERIELGPLKLPQGDFTLVLRVWADGEETSFHQLELAAP